MTTFAELQDSVITVTKRPDLVNETILALKRAIIKEHSAMDYPRDLAKKLQALTQPNPNNYRYELSLASLGMHPSARKIMEIEEALASQPTSIQSSSGYYGQLIFKERAPDNLFDGYNQEYQSYWYRFGSNLNIVAPRQVDNVLITYYAVPSTSVLVDYSDWMADLYDYVLYTHAAAEIFRIIGKSEEYKMQLAMTQENRLDIIRNEIGAI